MVEEKIKNILLKDGYKEHNIKFSGDEQRYLRINYWASLSDNALNELSLKNINLTELSFKDDDCGVLYYYVITN